MSEQESVFTRLYHNATTFDFVASRKRWFLLSAIILVISVASLGTRRLNLGVDFEGGTVVEVPNTASASLGDVRNALAGIGRAGDKVQITGGGERIRVQTGALSPGAEERLIATITDVAGVTVADASVETVGPTFGEQITNSAVRALIIFLLVVAAFISWRFEWKMAAAALVALFHDLLITAGIYSVTGLEVTPATVIAILTILGYSLYDTVVVFDKVNEEIDALGSDHEITSIINVSMNSVLMRSVNTSLTSLLPVGSLLFIGSLLLGAATLRDFALALFVGIASGTYSSIFVASPLVAIWKSNEEKWQRAARRAARRSSSPVVATPVAPPAAAEQVSVSRPEARPVQASGAVPRPPKRKKRRR